MTGFIEDYGYPVGSVGFEKFDPLLVSLHDDLKSLKDDRDNTALYGNVEQSIMNLVEAKLQSSQKTTVANIIVGIIKQARKDIRRNLSEKLAVRDDLHPSLLHYLAYDDIQVAEPVLMHSPQLRDMDILYIIQSKGEGHWRVLAKRPLIGEQIVQALSRKKDVDTNINLLDNETVTLCAKALFLIAETVSESDDVTNRLINYADLPKEIAVSIYWQVSQSVRQDIVNRFDIDPQVIDQPMEESMQDFSNSISNYDKLTPTKTMMDIAIKYNEQKSISESRLLDVLRRKQCRFFIALFSAKTNLGPDVVEGLLKQKSGQGLAVACRAVNISKEAFISIFLGTAPMVRERTCSTKEQMQMAIRYYEGLTHKMAKEILTGSMGKRVIA